MHTHAHTRAQVLRARKWEPNFPLFTCINRIITNKIQPPSILTYKVRAAGLLCVRERMHRGHCNACAPGAPGSQAVHTMQSLPTRPRAPRCAPRARPTGGQPVSGSGD